MTLGQEMVGPYTVALLVVLLVGLPIAAKFLRRAVRLEAGPLKAELGELTDYAQAAKEHAEKAAESAEAVHAAVNGVDPGEPKLIDQVRQLVANDAVKMDDLADLRTDVAALAVEVGNVQRFQRATAIGQAQLSAEVELGAARTAEMGKLLREHIDVHAERVKLDREARTGRIDRRHAPTGEGAVVLPSAADPPDQHQEEPPDG